MIGQDYDQPGYSTNDGVGQDAVARFKPGSARGLLVGATLTCVHADLHSSFVTVSAENFDESYLYQIHTRPTRPTRPRSCML